MDSRTPTLEENYPARLPAGSGPDSEPCHRKTPQGGKVLALGKIFGKTIRPFWPQWNPWADALPASRFEPLIVYPTRFLVWWGLLLFCLKLGSRRNLDFQLRDLELPICSCRCSRGAVGCGNWRGNISRRPWASLEASRISLSDCWSAFDTSG